ncbi:VOC family protein [Aeromicrobium duanguangcaii]|uniref:VOC family protein n=1 Tax=Aeromicrobium duanguangcaii TaxID=2968086 RepID=A0ABY5KF07_9ACTN|nr:VOC family protein [Aeromicrobium duanguangcaii]MCD9153879.1 VOC family protein [Aeromicrobium duanguangcaii]UUI69042.1 VOC family protein [Aeromicrobium duanguangcaii]
MEPLRLRQVVLITDDLDTARKEAIAAFGFPGSVRDEEGMASLGFIHDVFSFADTFIEIVAPISPDSPHGRQVAANGPSGFMIATQVLDLDLVVERAAEQGLAPLMHQEYDGHMISQWHPKALGTLTEIDQVDPFESWHFAPQVFAQSATDVAVDIAGATLAVPDPAAVASTWAALTGAPVEQDHTVRMGPESLSLVPSGDGPRGLVAVDVVAADPQQVGRVVELCGVPFRFVSPESQEQS